MGWGEAKKKISLPPSPTTKFVILETTISCEVAIQETTISCEVAKPGVNFGGM